MRLTLHLLVLAAPWLASGENIGPKLAQSLKLRPGDTVAEVGAGAGDSAVSLADVLAGSKVFVTELDARKLAALRQRASADRRLIPIEAGERDTLLPAACCDAIYMQNAYHHILQPADFLASVKRSLKPGGRFAVLDFGPTWYLRFWTPSGAPPNRRGHGIDPEETVRELKDAGFEILSREPNYWGRQYLVLARVP